MKVTVIETFQDKITLEHHHKGDVLNLTDQARVDVLVSKHLVEVAEPNIKPIKKPKTRSVDD